MLTQILLSGGDAAAQTSLKVNRVVWVAATGTASQNCAALRGILDDLAGTTSDSLAYLVRLEPGTYSCGTSTVTVPSHVALVGTGPRTTQIFGDPESPDTGVVHFDQASNSELRLLRIQHWGDTQDAVAISVRGSAVTFEHVEVFVQGTGQTSVGLRIESPGSEPENQSVVIVRNSSIYSNLNAISTVESGDGAVSADVFSSELGGSVDTFFGGSVRCAGSFELGTYDPLDKSCDPPP